jgi:hypothetical protein
MCYGKLHFTLYQYLEVLYVFRQCGSLRAIFPDPYDEVIRIPSIPTAKFLIYGMQIDIH